MKQYKSRILKRKKGREKWCERAIAVDYCGGAPCIVKCKNPGYILWFGESENPNDCIAKFGIVLCEHCYNKIAKGKNETEI